MKKFLVVYKDNEISKTIFDKINSFLTDHGMEYSQDKPDIVIAVGGDGTVLRAVHENIDILEKVVFCGVHTGTLGFYADFAISEVDSLLNHIINDEYIEKKHYMVEMKVFQKGKSEAFYALNEARVENNQRTQELKVSVDDHYFETFRGNGLNFASPSGSTGYNKSLGGAVIHPSTRTMQMCEVAGINNIIYQTLASPLVVSKDQIIRVESPDYQGAILAYDNNFINIDKEYPKLDKIEFRVADKYVAFARYEKHPFIRRVQRNFIGIV